MPSSDKLIKQGIRYTDRLFDDISKRLEKGIKSSDSLEKFLVKYHKAFPDKDNPLIALGYDTGMLDIILKETNNHKFSRPAQKELVRVAIENRVGDLIKDVGEDVRDSVREVVKDGYNNNLSQDEIATNISNKVSAIKGKRAKAIARTEIARTATISDYIINKERGATHFYVECRNTACPVCKSAWHKNWSKANDESFTPKDQSAGGKGWIGDRTFSMEDTKMLPPIHPNCRCVPYFIRDDEVDGSVEPVSLTPPTKNTTTETEPTETEPIPTSTNSMLKGKPTISHEIDGNGHKVTVYTYENGLKLAISERADFTFEEITAHIESLPEPLKNIETLNRIDIVGYPKKGISGEYQDIDKKIILYTTNKGSNALNTLTHELAHALDASQKVGKNYHLSLVDVYEKIVKSDNKLYTYVKSNGRKRTPNKFPTDYAGRSYIKNKKRYKEALKVWEKGSKDPKFKPVNKFYTEDFAESTMLYLNPKTHSKFVKEFPNRAKYLEEIYGKPKFDKNSILSKLLQKEEDLSKQLFEDELKREEQELKFDKLSKKELDSHLNKIFNGDKRKVEAYHKLRNDERKLYSVSRAVSAGDIDILIKAGWDKSTAKKIMANPNDFLPKVNSRKRQVSNMLEKIDNLIISQL